MTLAVGMILLPGCQVLKPKPKLTKLSIPDMGSAKDQFTYAARFQANSFPGGSPERRRDLRNQFRQVYSRVVTGWPDDQEYTPAAKLILADLDREDGNWRKALHSYREIQQQYPNYAAVRVRAMFHEAGLLDSRKQYDEAKTIYRRIMTEYANHPDKRVEPIVKQATALYYMVRKVEPERKTEPL
jgi:tetratricopeptide (TPR) repeat protein